MKVLRVLLLALAAAAIALALAAVIGLSPGFQTWAVRRALARPGASGISLGRLEADFGAVEITDLRVARDGAVLTVPFLRVELPTAKAILHRRLLVGKLVAAGWTFDLSRVVRLPALGAVSLSPPSATVRSFSFATSAEAAPEAEPASLFRSLFSRLTLPFDLSLDGAELDGQIILPPPPGGVPTRVRANIAGGGLGAGRDGRFAVRLAATGDPAASIQSLTVESEVSAVMDTPRTFARLGLRLNAVAFGPKLPRGVRLVGDFSAARAPNGESFSAVLSGENKPIATILLDVPAFGGRPAGSWTVNVSDDDLTPFALGRVLPAFMVAGQGRFDCDPQGGELHVLGGVDATGEHLGVIRPALEALGPVRVTGDFDVTHSGPVWRIDRISALVQGARPILAARSLQSFGFDDRTGELNVSRADQPLFGIALEGLPSEWLRIVFPGADFAGGPVRGELTATARQGRLNLRTTEPLSVSGLSFELGGRPWVSSADVSCQVTADYTEEGWQVVIAKAWLDSAGRRVVEGQGKIGRQPGDGRPIEAEGRLRVDLPGLLAQPFLMSRAGSGLSAGTLSAEFTTDLGQTCAVKAKLALSGLVAADSGSLPDVTADLQAGRDEAGRERFSLPLTLRNGERRSDLVVTGSRAAGWAGQIAGGQVYLDDVLPFAVVGESAFALRRPAAAGGGAGGPPAAASFGIRLGRVDYGRLGGTDFQGELDYSGGRATLRGATFRLDSGGVAKADAELVNSGEAGQPWSVRVTGALGGFDPAPILRRLNPDEPPAIEGQFTLSGSFAGRGTTPAEAAARLRGDCAVRSAGGHFRLLSAAIAPKGGGGGALGTILGVADKLIPWLKAGDFANPAEAVIYFGKAISDIPYDQLSFTLARDGAGNTEIRDVALICPELRLQGGGRIRPGGGEPLAEQPLEARFKLSARGRAADALKKLGVLAAKPDDLGYRACLVPLTVGGSLDRPDTADLQAALLKLVAGSGGFLGIFGK